jgi:hypothetical protein
MADGHTPDPGAGEADAEVAEQHEEAIERGANVKGAGQI